MDGKFKLKSRFIYWDDRMSINFSSTKQGLRVLVEEITNNCMQQQQDASPITTDLNPGVRTPPYGIPW